MSGKEIKSENGKFVERRSTNFESMLARSEARTDKKFDKLIDSVDKIAESVHILITQGAEYKKDQEYNVKRMDRMEETTNHLVDKFDHVADQVLIIHERQEKQEKSKSRIITWISSVSSALSVLAIAIWWGLK